MTGKVGGKAGRNQGLMLRSSSSASHFVGKDQALGERKGEPPIDSQPYPTTPQAVAGFSAFNANEKEKIVCKVILVDRKQSFRRRSSRVSQVSAQAELLSYYGQQLIAHAATLFAVMTAAFTLQA